MDKVCFICSASPAIHNLEDKWGTKWRDQVVTQMCRVLRVNPLKLEPGAGWWVCLICLPILEEVASLLRKAEVTQLLVSSSVESIGRRVLLSSSATGVGGRGREKDKIWKQFNQPVIQNFVEGILPSPSVHVTIDPEIELVQDDDLEGTEVGISFGKEQICNSRKKEDMSRTRKQQSKDRIKYLFLEDKIDDEENGSGTGSSGSESTDLEDIFVATRVEKMKCAKIKVKKSKSEPAPPIVRTQSDSEPGRKRRRPRKKRKDVEVPATPVQIKKERKDLSLNNRLKIKLKTSENHDDELDGVTRKSVNGERESDAPTTFKPSKTLESKTADPLPLKRTGDRKRKRLSLSPAADNPESDENKRKRSGYEDNHNQTGGEISTPRLKFSQKKKSDFKNFPRYSRPYTPLYGTQDVNKAKSKEDNPEDKINRKPVTVCPAPNNTKQKMEMQCPTCSEKFEECGGWKEALSSHYFYYHINVAAKLSKAKHSFKCKHCDLFFSKLCVPDLNKASTDVVAGTKMAAHYLEMHEKVFSEVGTAEKEIPIIKPVGSTKVDTIKLKSNVPKNRAGPKSKKLKSQVSRQENLSVSSLNKNDINKEDVKNTSKKNKTSKKGKDTPTSDPQKSIRKPPTNDTKDAPAQIPQPEEDCDLLGRRRSLRNHKSNEQVPKDAVVSANATGISTLKKKKISVIKKPKPGPKSKTMNQSVSGGDVPCPDSKSQQVKEIPKVVLVLQSETPIPRVKMVARTLKCAVKEEPKSSFNEHVLMSEEEEEDYERKSTMFINKKRQLLNKKSTQSKLSFETIDGVNQDESCDSSHIIASQLKLAKSFSQQNVQESNTVIATTNHFNEPVSPNRTVVRLMNSPVMHALSKTIKMNNTKHNEILVESGKQLAVTNSSTTDRFQCPTCKIIWVDGYEAFLEHNWSHKTSSQQKKLLNAPIGIDIPQSIREELIFNGRTSSSFVFSDELVAELILYEQYSKAQALPAIIGNADHSIVPGNNLFSVEEPNPRGELSNETCRKRLKCRQCSHYVPIEDGLRFKDVEIKLIIHFLQHHFVRAHICEICGQGFSEELFLQRHYEISHFANNSIRH